MATNALTGRESAGFGPARRQQSTTERSPLWYLTHWVLLPLASLRLTVLLFVLAIVLVFAGTLAQENKDIWEVMQEYFRTPLAWIEFQVFFPKSFFNGNPPQIPGGFYFPGGFMIGGAMLVNLLAAHALRFKTQATGARLWAGLAVIAVGVALTWLVVVGGSGKDAIESAAPIPWSGLAVLFKLTLGGLWLAGLYALWKQPPRHKLQRGLLIGGELLLGGVLAWMLWQGDDAALGDSSLRILWQLAKGGVAGLVLLAGCVMVFRKRAGIVLLHAGVALVMANELVVYSLHVEGQMRIKEGETVNYAYDVRDVELAVVDPADPKTDDVVVVPRKLLSKGAKVSDAQLPFDVEVVDYLQNSMLVPPKAGEKNPATEGFGKEVIAEPRRPGAGTDAGGNVDITSAYVTLLDKKSHRPLGTYLVSTVTDLMAVPPQKVTVGDKTYELALRYRRDYKPYSMRLADVRFDKYLGTQTAKNYSSDVRLVDTPLGVDRDVHIWMNNPLRFGNETFYQSNYFVDKGREGTVLQVVTNTGWMIPYVACMLVVIGMLAQFSITLVRFLQHRSAAEIAATSQPSSRRRVVVPTASWSSANFLVPVCVVTMAALFVVSVASPKHAPLEEMQVEEFGRLPLVYEGRVKPFDTVARNTLRYISGKQTFTDETGEKPLRGQPAIKWLLDTIASPEKALKHKVFRIENLELLDSLGLKRREGFRYSISEFTGRLGDLEREAEQAGAIEPARLNTYQKKLLELVKKLRLVRLMTVAFDPPHISREHAQEDIANAARQLDALSRMQPPLSVPPAKGDGEWEPFATAWFDGLKDRARGEEPNPAMMAMTSLIVSYGNGDAKAFNADLAKYQNLLAEHPPADYDAPLVGYEAYFNQFEPFWWAMILYVLAFVLVALGWLGWNGPLNRAAFWLLVFTLGLHTFALVSRMVISGRPPVTNLYSSAVFIGWGGVVLGLILEMVYRLGIGNVIAAVAGFSTLVIAHFLAGLTDGDTMGVLQAVLDTQFWLATHVVCITLGYATTFIAGLLGVLYILRGVLTPSLSAGVSKDLARMIYGTICFAMFFSFFGTVLGGLWADDSWGRFWGWDPKENGALIIVLWNALVLHARWGGMVHERGLAALAVGGNIVTSWSWFGVNELGVGLHSYGFTEGVLMSLGIVILTQLAVIALALVPRHKWWSSRTAA